MAPPIYPELPGLAFDWIRRPNFENDRAPHVSGREVRVAYFPAQPIWEWDLIYDVLRDFPCGTIPSELKRLEGFFFEVRANLDAFLFRDPDDWQVSGQFIATTDGVSLCYALVRTYGDGSYTSQPSAGPPFDTATETEPVGYVDLAQPLNVYLGGLLQPPSSYTLAQGSPGGASIVTFTTLPAAGLNVTVDMSYYFWARFSPDYLDFEKFADRFWLLRKVTIRSQRMAIAGCPPLMAAPPPPPPPPPPGPLPSFDGKNACVLFGGWDPRNPDNTATITCTLSTALPNDIIIAWIVEWLSPGSSPSLPPGLPSPPVFTTPNSPTLGAFTQRGATIHVPGITGTGNQPGAIATVALFWAPSPGILTNEPVSYVIPGGTEAAFLNLMAVHGARSLAAPWDPATSPVTKIFVGTTTHPAHVAVSGLTTSGSNFVIGAAGLFNDTTATAPSPSGSAAAAVQPFIGVAVESILFGTPLAPPLSSGTVNSISYPNGQPTITNNWIMIADAIAG